MDANITQAIERAREVLDQLGRFEVTKTIWSSPAGKKRIAKKLASMLPSHKTYVEPFAGSAAVLFAKEPSEIEAINDADQEIVQAYRRIKRITKAQIDQLGSMTWVGSPETYKRVRESKPSGDVAKLHRFLYLTHFSYGRLRGNSFSPSSRGVTANTVKRVAQYAPRLKNVEIHGGDYDRVVKQYDGPNTVFFLDPPYVGYDVKVGESKFDEEHFFEVLKSIKGKFLLTYGVRGKLPKLLKSSRFNIKRIRTPRYIRSMRGVEGPEMLTQLVVTNYMPLEKRLIPDDEWIIEDWDVSDEPVKKVQPFGTFGGSHHYAKRIVPLIPDHNTYVEPFAGAAAVLYAKDPSAKEVLADLDADLVFMHRFIKGLTADKLEKLKGFDWTCTESSWKRVRDMTPDNDLERFYKLAFIRGKGRDARPDATHPAGAALGQTTNPEKYLRASERLKDVTILRQDYRKTISAHDGPDTFFFIDPPYPGEWFDKDAVIDLDEFIAALKGIKGGFIAVLNDSKENVAAFKQVGQVFRLKVREASGTGGAKQASRLFCSNYRVRKCNDIDKAVWSRSYINDLPDDSFLYIEPDGEKDEDGKTVPRRLRHFPVRDMDGELDLPHVRNAIARIPQSKIPGLSDDEVEKLQEEARKLLAEALKKSGISKDVDSASFSKSIPLIKNIDPEDERYVLGVVLEPEVVDAQGDIYSAEEIRRAAHRFMEDFQGLGLMHRFQVNGQVKILESYLAPVDFEIGNTKIRKDTWLLAVRVLSDELWAQIKDGAIGGFSIGGSARRVLSPESNALNQEKKVQKRDTEPQDSGPKTQDSVHRLLDLLVEEVSLVDHAANKKRFLIVKRSNDMADNDTQGQPQGAADGIGNSPPSTPDSTGQGATPPGGDASGQDENTGVPETSAALAVAVDALEGLTEAVEALSGTGDGDAGTQLSELAAQFRGIAERLSPSGDGKSKGANPAASGDGNSDGGTDPKNEGSAGGENPGELAQTLSALQSVLQPLKAMVEAAAKPQGPRPPQTSAAPPTAEPVEKSAGQGGLAQQLGLLTAAVSSMAGTVKAQQQRLAHIEKSFGLPHSTPTEKPGASGRADESWPFDINAPVDRESVDKSVSFHD